MEEDYAEDSSGIWAKNSHEAPADNLSHRPPALLAVYDSSYATIALKERIVS